MVLVKDLAPNAVLLDKIALGSPYSLSVILEACQIGTLLELKRIFYVLERDKNPCFVLLCIIFINLQYKIGASNRFVKNQTFSSVC